MIKCPRTVFEIEDRFQAKKHVLATKIQTTWRRHVAHKWYNQLRTAAIRCQRLVRQRARRRRLFRLKEYEIAVRKIVLVQKNVRRFLAMSAYKKMSTAALTIRKYILSLFYPNLLKNIKIDFYDIIIEFLHYL